MFGSRNYWCGMSCNLIHITAVVTCDSNCKQLHSLRHSSLHNLAVEVLRLSACDWSWGRLGQVAGICLFCTRCIAPHDSAAPGSKHHQQPLRHKRAAIICVIRPQWTGSKEEAIGGGLHTAWCLILTSLGEVCPLNAQNSTITPSSLKPAWTARP